MLKCKWSWVDAFYHCAVARPGTTGPVEGIFYLHHIVRYEVHMWDHFRDNYKVLHRHMVKSIGTHEVDILIVISL